MITSRLKIIFILLITCLACTSNKEQKDNNTTDVDSTQQTAAVDNQSPHQEETEEEEMERILKERYLEDIIAFTELTTYDGEYRISTESEGVDATLQLKYNGDQTFDYQWKLAVTSEETTCKGEMKGVLTMDQTQHGFDKIEDCFVHFNFNGYFNDGYVVEIDFEDQTKCASLTGECIFSGTYINKK